MHSTGPALFHKRITYHVQGNGQNQLLLKWQCLQQGGRGTRDQIWRQTQAIRDRHLSCRALLCLLLLTADMEQVTYLGHICVCASEARPVEGRVHESISMMPMQTSGKILDQYVKKLNRDNYMSPILFSFQCQIRLCAAGHLCHWQLWLLTRRKPESTHYKCSMITLRARPAKVHGVAWNAQSNDGFAYDWG